MIFQPQPSEELGQQVWQHEENWNLYTHIGHRALLGGLQVCLKPASTTEHDPVSDLF